MVVIKDCADSTIEVEVTASDMENGVMEVNFAKELIDYIYEKRQKAIIEEEALEAAHGIEPNNEDDDDED